MNEQTVARIKHLEMYRLSAGALDPNRELEFIILLTLVKKMRIIRTSQTSDE
jgi:hypothetical protein